MRGVKRFTALLLLLAPAAFSQRAGHSVSAAPPHAAPASSHAGHGTVTTNHAPAARNGRVAIVSTGRRDFRNGRGYGLYSPYYPLLGYGSSYLPVYGDDYQPAPYSEAGPPPQIAGPPPLPQIASPVIHEYKTSSTFANLQGPKPSFTIVLKDGSTRTARASWVQGGKLHFVDAQSRQQLLLPGDIDRSATEKANEAKNLSMELPPG